MKYKFIGKDGSCNFIHGQIYDLELYRHFDKNHIPYIMACSRYVQVPYSGMNSFEKNWVKIGG